MTTKPRIVSLLASLALLPLTVQPSRAQTGCVNYWVNPATGQEECLDTNQPLKLQPAAPRFTDAELALLTEYKRQAATKPDASLILAIAKDPAHLIRQANLYCEMRRAGISEEEIRRVQAKGLLSGNASRRVLDATTTATGMINGLSVVMLCPEFR